MIVDDSAKTSSILLQQGYILSMTPVLVIAVPDQPGGLVPALSTLAEGNIDIEYMYSLFLHTEGKAYMVFRVQEEEKFVALLATHGITPCTAQELGLG